MGTIQRISVAAGIWMASAIVAVWWLYFLPTVEPLVQQFSGPFSDTWGLFVWAVPTTLLIIDLLAGGYLLFGGIQNEVARDQQVRRR